MKKPLYSHPCTWVFIDDHTRFLRALDATLPEHQPRKLFDKPREALEFLKGCQSADFLKPTSSYEDEELVLRLDLGRITSRLTDANRFAQVSVVVCDYAMPGMNGLELLEQIPDRAIKRILLTGVADEETAVAAFNAGTIDRFVKKGSGAAIEQLMVFVEQQDQARMEMGQTELLRHLGLAGAVMLDRGFESFFEIVLDREDVHEYYFSGVPRGYHLKLHSGMRKFLLLVRHNEFTEQAKTLERLDASAELVAEVENSLKYTTIFESIEDAFNGEYDWEANTCETSPIPGLYGWFFGIVDNPPGEVDLHG